MLAKSLLAGLVSAVMAGGVVYYGTEPVAKKNTRLTPPAQTPLSISADIHASKDKKFSADRLEKTLASPQSKKVATTDIADVRSNAGKADMSSSAPEKKRWLDQYLKKQKDSAPETEPEIQDIPSALRFAASAEKAEMAEMVMPETKIDERENIDLTSETKSPNVRNYDDLMPEDNPEQRGDEGDNVDSQLKVERQVEAEMPRFEADLSRQADADLNMDKPSDKTGVFDVVFHEIQAFDAPELKDQAYFFLVTKALDERAYAVARKAINLIKTPEMKETARINLAVTYGRDGDFDTAFALVNDVEQGEYRDILRLQVIEALMGPVAQ